MVTPPREPAATDPIPLPPPAVTGTVPLEAVLAARRSVRYFSRRPLLLAELGQLLWAGQGVSDRSGLRTAPSAGARYPVELSAVVGGLEGLAPGVYRYWPQGHALSLTAAGDRRAALAAAALGQSWVQDAPVSIAISAAYERTTGRYGERGVRYVHMDVAAAGENILLQAVALGLGAVMVGAFRDEAAHLTLALPPAERLLLLIPIGHPR